MEEIQEVEEAIQQEIAELHLSEFCQKYLPAITNEVEIAYVIFMVLYAIKSQDIAWHKHNIAASAMRTLFYAKGIAITTALFMGTPAIVDVIIDKNYHLLIILTTWWLVLFTPFDIVNKIVYFKIGIFQPLIFPLMITASVYRVLTVEITVHTFLAKNEGSCMSILVGTLVGNGILPTAVLFGEFATELRSQHSKIAFISALVFATEKILLPDMISPCLAVTLCIGLNVFVQLVSNFTNRFNILDGLCRLMQSTITLDILKCSGVWSSNPQPKLQENLPENPPPDSFKFFTQMQNRMKLQALLGCDRRQQMVDNPNPFETKINCEQTGQDGALSSSSGTDCEL